MPKTNQPKKAVGTQIEDWLQAEEAYREVFGEQLPELQAAVIAETVRAKVDAEEAGLRQAIEILEHDGYGDTEMLRSALKCMRTLRTSHEDETIRLFNAEYRLLKDAILLSNELTTTLTEPARRDLSRAQTAVCDLWPLLAEDVDLPKGLAARVAELTNLLDHDLFFRELPLIEQHTTAINEAYRQCFEKALDARVAAYSRALATLHGSDGWSELKDPERRRTIDVELRVKADRYTFPATNLRALRWETSACPEVLRTAVREMMEVLEGKRLATLDVLPFFGTRVKNEKQLDKALAALREECVKLLAAGKTVLIQ